MHEAPPPVSAGPCVSDERLAALVQSAEWRQSVLHKQVTLTDRLALDLADARAQIAALERLAQAVRDATPLLMHDYYEIHDEQWDHISGLAWNGTLATTPAEGARCEEVAGE